MAEKGIVVTDADSGESVACRDAAELDDDSNARIIQRVDVSKGKLPTPFIAAANLIRSDETSGDGTTGSNYATAGVFTNVLTVGDKSTLVVQVQTEDTSSGVVKIVPLLVESDGTTMQGILASQTFDFGADDYIYSPVGGSLMVSHFMTWEVTGGDKIAIVIYSWDDSYTNINVYAAVI